MQLIFEIRQEQDIYDDSDFGDPAQFSIWLEDLETQAVRTVFVTHSTGTGEFIGKVDCPVALPVWIGIFREETGRTDFPRPWKPMVDAVTGATPKVKEFAITTLVESGKTWNYYIEMNVAGDYNATFPSMTSGKHPDYHGNGQPSLIYRGRITATRGATSKPELIGRSLQHYFTTTINPDLTGIGSARKAFSAIAVICK